MFIEPRKAVTVDELLHGMIVQSGNDASIALAELVAGTEEAFVERMNAGSGAARLDGTHFINATGLSNPQHYSTAADLAQLAAALIRDYPEYYPLYSQKEFRYNNITQSNRNRLLWTDPYVDGMKTGHTDAAGWCLVASAKRGERRLVSVVLGAASDAARARREPEAPELGLPGVRHGALYQSGKPVTTLRVWKGAKRDVAAGFLADRYLTLPKGKADKLALTMEAKEPLVAPVRTAQPVGVVKVALDGKPMAEFPLIALEEVPPANLFGRAVDTVRLWFTKPLEDRRCADADRRSSTSTASSCRSPRRRSRCSTAASSTATACTRSCPCTAASRSACRSTSRACSTASTASASPIRIRRRRGTR